MRLLKRKLQEEALVPRERDEKPIRLGFPGSLVKKCLFLECSRSATEDFGFLLFLDWQMNLYAVSGD